MSPPDREPVVLVSAADDRYVQPLAVMLHSALNNLSSPGTSVVYILDGGITPAHKHDLVRSCSSLGAAMHWLPVTAPPLSGLPLWGRMPVATYYKLLIGDLIPASVSKAIWLDCDLVVLSDLQRLWNTDMAGRHALAAQDVVVPLVSSRNGVGSYRQLGIPSDAPYFNAGVMVVNLELWRRDRIPDRVLEYLRRHRDTVVFWDQEGLNAVLAGKWGALDPRWNYNVAVRGARLRGVHHDADEPWIVHFTGKLKPWIYPRRDAFHALYFRYLDLTVWAGYRPKRSLTGRMVELYERSGLRHVLYPGEEWAVRLVRARTRKYASEVLR